MSTCMWHYDGCNGCRYLMAINWIILWWDLPFQLSTLSWLLFAWLQVWVAGINQSFHVVEIALYNLYRKHENVIIRISCFAELELDNIETHYVFTNKSSLHLVVPYVQVFPIICKQHHMKTVVFLSMYSLQLKKHLS